MLNAVSWLWQSRRPFLSITFRELVTHFHFIDKARVKGYSPLLLITQRTPQGFHSLDYIY